MEERTLMRLDEFVAPGLKKRPNKKGGWRLYWCARSDLVKAGYRPETVRLPFEGENPADLPLISAACLRYQAEMLEWSAGQRADPYRFDGTIRGLSRRYQTDPASPFARLKHATRDKDLYVLKTIEAAFGNRTLANIGLTDLWRWYNAAKEPKAPRQLKEP
jgi:hypothetical protein